MWSSTGIQNTSATHVDISANYFLNRPFLGLHPYFFLTILPWLRNPANVLFLATNAEVRRVLSNVELFRHGKLTEIAYLQRNT